MRKRVTPHTRTRRHGYRLLRRSGARRGAVLYRGCNRGRRTTCTCFEEVASFTSCRRLGRPQNSRPAPFSAFADAYTAWRLERWVTAASLCPTGLKAARFPTGRLLSSFLTVSTNRVCACAHGSGRIPRTVRRQLPRHHGCVFVCRLGIGGSCQHAAFRDVPRASRRTVLGHRLICSGGATFDVTFMRGAQAWEQVKDPQRCNKASSPLTDFGKGDRYTCMLRSIE